MLTASYDMRRKHASIYYSLKSCTILVVVLGIGSITYLTNHQAKIKYDTLSLAQTVNQTYNNVTHTDGNECHILSVSDEDRCAYALNNTICNHYIQLQYCQFQSIQPLFYILAVPYLITLLYCLGNVADGFLVPLLMKLSDALHMPPALAGVTLLALGNGAPDISSILVGVFTNKVDFAIGDPIGGGLFDTALVMGVIPFVAHVRVSQLPFIRDVVFYLISVSYIFYIFMDNRVTLYEGVICIVIYIIYVLVVIIGRFINVHVVQRFRKKKGEPAPEQSSEETPQTTVEQESSELPEIQIDPPTEDLKTSDVPVITIQVDPPSDVGPPVIKTSGDDWTSGYTVQRRLSQDFKRRSEERRRSTELTEENLQRLSQDGKISLSPPRESLPQSMTDFIVPTVDETPADEPQEKKKLLTLLYERFCDLTGWDGMKWYERVLFVVIAWFPNLLQNLTIPKVDEKDWNRFYIVCVPIFAPLLVLYATGDTLGSVFPVAVILFISGVLVSILLIIILWRFDKQPKWFVPILMIVSFCMCVIWLYICSSEVQYILQALGRSCDAIMALTVLSWGNSLGDLVANVSVVKQGYGSMGIGACYGGPMLNLLVGLGIAFTFNKTQLSEFCFTLTPDPAVGFSFIVLISILLLSLVVIPACKFNHTKPFGIVLILFYIVFLVVAVVISFVPVVKEAFTWRVDMLLFILITVIQLPRMLIAQATCREIIKATPTATSGYYTIYPNGVSYSTFCDMSIEYGGWTFIGNMTASGSGAWSGYTFNDHSVTFNELHVVDNAASTVKIQLVGPTYSGFYPTIVGVVFGPSSVMYLKDNGDYSTCGRSSFTSLATSYYRTSAKGVIMTKPSGATNLVKLVHYVDYGTLCNLNTVYNYNFGFYIRQKYTCNSISEYDTASVCSGSGTCTSTDTCSCKTGYTGTWCQTVITTTVTPTPVLTTTAAPTTTTTSTTITPTSVVPSTTLATTTTPSPTPVPTTSVAPTTITPTTTVQATTTEAVTTTTILPTTTVTQTTTTTTSAPATTVSVPPTAEPTTTVELTTTTSVPTTLSTTNEPTTTEASTATITTTTPTPTPEPTTSVAPATVTTTTTPVPTDTATVIPTTVFPTTTTSPPTPAPTTSVELSTTVAPTTVPPITSVPTTLDPTTETASLSPTSTPTTVVIEPQTTTVPTFTPTTSPTETPSTVDPTTLIPATSIPTTDELTTTVTPVPTTETPATTSMPSTSEIITSPPTLSTMEPTTVEETTTNTPTITVPPGTTTFMPTSTQISTDIPIDSITPTPSTSQTITNEPTTSIATETETNTPTLSPTDTSSDTTTSPTTETSSSTEQATILPTPTFETTVTPTGRDTSTPTPTNQTNHEITYSPTATTTTTPTNHVTETPIVSNTPTNTEITNNTPSFVTSETEIPTNFSIAETQYSTSTHTPSLTPTNSAVNNTEMDTSTAVPTSTQTVTPSETSATTSLMNSTQVETSASPTTITITLTTGTPTFHNVTPTPTNATVQNSLTSDQPTTTYVPTTSATTFPSTTTIVPTNSSVTSAAQQVTTATSTNATAQLTTSTQSFEPTIVPATTEVPTPTDNSTASLTTQTLITSTMPQTSTTEIATSTNSLTVPKPTPLFTFPTNSTQNSTLSTYGAFELALMSGNLTEAVSLGYEMMENGREREECIILMQEFIPSNMDTQTMERVAKFIELISNKPSELSIASIVAIINITDTLSTALGHSYHIQSVVVVSNILSNALEALQHQNDLTLVPNVKRVVKVLQESISSNMNIGQSPTIITTSFLSLLVYRDTFNSRVELSTPFADFSIPGSPARTLNDISIRVNTVKLNLLPNSENITSQVVSIGFYSPIQQLDVSNMSVPFVFSLPIVDPTIHNMLAWNKNTSIGGYQPVCKFWDTRSLNWSTFGCITVNMTSTQIVCACSHTTDFATFWDYVFPTFNVLTLSDIENITKLNPDNMLTCIIICAMALIYVCSVILVAVVEKITSSCLNKSSKEQEIEFGKFRILLQKFMKEHYYIATIFHPKGISFTRIQRITVIYASILGIMGGNALTFANDAKENIFKFIVSGAISALIQAPFVTLFIFLFSRTKPWTSIERVDPSLEIPTSEKKRKPIACTKRILDKLDKLSDKVVTGIKSISTRASWQGVLLVIITSTVYVGLLVVLAVLAGLWMQLFAGLCQWIIVSVGILIYTGFLFITFFRLQYEKLQEGTIEKWRGSTVQLVVLISSAVIGWTLGVVGSIVIGVLIPVSNEWFGKLMVVSLSVTGMAILCTFAAILLFKNFYVQPLRRDSQDSTSSEFHGIAPDSPLRPSATPFPTDDALQMTRRQAIATNFMNEQMFEKLKKKSLISKIMDPIKETLKSQFIFPRWFIIVDFSICMVYCITLSVVLIIYGIKFDTGHFGSSDTQWLLGSGIGLGLDIFVSIPIFFIITNVVYIGLIQILQGIFFPVDKSKKYEMRVQEESTYDWSRKRPSLASQADSSVPEKMESALDLPIDASNIELDVL